MGGTCELESGKWLTFPLSTVEGCNLPTFPQITSIAWFHLLLKVKLQDFNILRRMAGGNKF